MVRTSLTKPEHDPASNGSSSSPNGGQPPAQTPPAAGGAHSVPAAEPAPRTCSKCGAPMQEGQDWCLQCGAGAPSSLGGGPGWRTGVAILAVTALLVGGASVAAYAALDKSPAKTKALVAVKTTTSTAPGTATTPGATSTPGATTTPIPTSAKETPPKIPLQTPTPKSSGAEGNEANNTLFPPETGKSTKTPTKTTEPSKSTSEPSEGSKESSGSETKTSGEEAPSPILLDTDAASTYNPYAYPASLFGEPSLAIDGEASTAWTAQVNPASAPKMAEGLVLDLKSAQKLGSVKVKTTTTGMTVEVRGSNSHTLPSSINDPGWTQLSAVKVLKKKSSSIKLKTGGKAYRLILLWISKASATSTPTNPGQVAVNELELFPPAS